MHKGWSTIEALHQHQGYWDDLRFPISSVRGVIGKPPTETAYRGGLVLAFSSSSDNAIAFNAQMPHGYDELSEPELHIHFTLPTAGAGAGAENIKFDLTYSWADIGAAWPTETTLSATLDVQNMAADTHYLMDIGTLLISNRAINGGTGVSSMIICSLTRDVSVANDYASSVYMAETDFHLLSNAPGSREEYLK